MKVCLEMIDVFMLFILFFFIQVFHIKFEIISICVLLAKINKNVYVNIDPEMLCFLFMANKNFALFSAVAKKLHYFKILETQIMGNYCYLF